MAGSHANVDGISELIRELRLDKEKCPITKVNQVTDLLKTKVDFKLISVKHFSKNGVTYLVEAGSNGITALGKSDSSTYDAQKNAAFNLFEKLASHCSIMSFTSKVACKINPEKNKESTETISGNKRNSLTTSLSSDCISDLSLVNYEMTDNCNRGYNPTTSSSTLLDKRLSAVSENSVSKHTTMNYTGLLLEKCYHNNWKLPKYDCSKLVYYGCPEFTVSCFLLAYITKGKGRSEEMAKTQAAWKMYDLIKNIYFEDHEVVFEDKTPFNYLFHKTQFQNYEKVVSANTLKNFETFFEQCHESNSFNIIKKNAVNFLGKIANAEGFTVKYIVVYQNSDQTKVLAQLSTIPIAVNIGKGSNKHEAQQDAAYTSIEYLQSKFNNHRKPLFFSG